MAVLPSPESETEIPSCVIPTAPASRNCSPCCIQLPFVRPYTQADPSEPTMPVFPSAESATEVPCHVPRELVFTSLLPCCTHTPFVRAYTHTAPIFALS